MFYGYTGKPAKPLSAEEKAAREKIERKKRRTEIIVNVVLCVLLSPILLPLVVLAAIFSLLYLGVCKIVEIIKNWKDNGGNSYREMVKREDRNTMPILVSHSLFECDKELPVRFDKYYVVYVETEYNKPLNDFIRSNIGYIRKGFSKQNYHFVYVPEIKKLSDAELLLAFPIAASMMTDDIKNRIRHISTVEFTRMYAEVTGIDLSEHKAGLLSLCHYEGDMGISTDVIDYSKSTLLLVDMDNVAADRIKDAFDEYFRCYCGEKHVPFSVRPRDEYPLDSWQEGESCGLQSEASDSSFLIEQKNMQLIADDIRHKVEILKQGGYIELLLHTLGADIVKQIEDSRKSTGKLMHIVVADDLRVSIPELGNLEVKMPTLSRVLYVFYLRHREGVEFKFLSEYTDEILALYRLASNRLDDRKLRATVESLVNPTENKINECVSRIKAAFLKVMDDYLARNYYLKYNIKEIHKEDSNDSSKILIYKDMAKFVSLPRHLVTYSDSIREVPFIKGKSFDERCFQEEKFRRRLNRMNELTAEIENVDSKGLRLKKRKERLQQLKAEQMEASKAVLELEPMNFLAHFNLGEAYCNAIDYAKAISENTMLIEHDAYTWNAAYINRAEAYLYASEYDKGLADIDSYFNSLRRWKEGDKEAERIKKNLLRMKSKS